MIVAVVAGVVVGLVAPDIGSVARCARHAVRDLIKMMISPVIFCTIVLGIGSVRKAASVGKVGGLALVYFLIMSTVALAIGLLVGNLISPGTRTQHFRRYAEAGGEARRAGPRLRAARWNSSKTSSPTTLLSSLTAGNVLQTLFVALLVGFGIQAMGRVPGSRCCAA